MIEQPTKPASGTGAEEALLREAVVAIRGLRARRRQDEGLGSAVRRGAFGKPLAWRPTRRRLSASIDEPMAWAYPHA